MDRRTVSGLAANGLRHVFLGIVGSRNARPRPRSFCTIVFCTNAHLGSYFYYGFFRLPRVSLPGHHSPLISMRVSEVPTHKPRSLLCVVQVVLQPSGDRASAFLL